MGAAQSIGFDSGNTPAWERPNWMSNIDNDISIAGLSIPGTRNSVSFPGYGGSMYVCQSWPLYTQLEAGIRFLDIRCGHCSDKLYIYTGRMYQYVIFNDVITDVIRFLNAHPREAILMRITQEYIGYRNTRSMKETFDSYMKNLPDDMRKCFYSASEIPTLGKVRGQIIILNDFTTEAELNNSTSTIAEGENFTGIFYRDLDVVDQYYVATILSVSITWKWRYMEEHLKAACDGKADKLFLTFAGGSSLWAYPNAVAHRINPKLVSFFGGSEGKKRWGIVAMDFPGADLIDMIINSNRN